MEIYSTPLSPVPFSCTGQIDEKRTSSWMVFMPQQCCLRSRSLSRHVDLPPHRRTFFVTPRPNTGDISDNKGNTACPPAAVLRQMSSMCTPPPVSHLRCHWWHRWWHEAKDVSPLPLTLSSELGVPTSLRDYDPLQRQQSLDVVVALQLPPLLSS